MTMYVTLLMLCLPIVTGVKLFPSLDHVRSSASLGDQEQAVRDLIGRRLGEQASHFKVVINANTDRRARDTFNLLSNGSTVTISATSGISAAMGFYYYLKTLCGCQFTWAGEQLNLPHPLPTIDIPGITVTSNDRFRYYQNVCTVSYSFAFWDWSRWERHIDWMAMNGINLPLAFTGQEAIFQRVYMKMGMTVEELQEHFAGPAFLAWARMGNMRGWGGPLPQSWIDGQVVLQHQILARTRQLGMIPVLPAFAGHVPNAITRLYPNASVSRMRDWGHMNKTYCCTYLLDFKDTLFNQIGTAFINELKAEFGVDHVYNADTFNEMDPKSNSTSYLQSAGTAVFKAMNDADPNAIWLMQGWLFSHNTDFWKDAQVQAYLTSVPEGRMIVLDLASELRPVYLSTKMFYGQPFIWCMLHNFGGTMELYGVIEAVNKGPFIARNHEYSTMVGTGLTPEGIFQNEVMYEFMNENALAKAPRNLTQWFMDYTTRRYGRYNDDANLAWQLLKLGVYNNTDGLEDHSKFVMPTWRPSLKIHMPDVWYDPGQLYQAWGHMVNASSLLGGNKLFRYDLVDIGRNSLQMLSIKYYIEMTTAYKDNNTQMLQTAGEDMVQLLGDMDRLLGSDQHFLLGTWLRDARSWGTSTQERDLMEYNARNQITLWGPEGNVRDYAAKQWSGLISSYYARRWEHFYQTLLQCLEEGRKFQQDLFNKVVLEMIEKPFTFDKSPFPVTPTGDSVGISAAVYNKYIPAM